MSADHRIVVRIRDINLTFVERVKNALIDVAFTMSEVIDGDITIVSNSHDSFDVRCAADKAPAIARALNAAAALSDSIVTVKA